VIWTYPKPESGERGWRKISNQPPGIKVLDIAVAGNHLYAVTSRKGVSLGDSGYYRLKDDASGWDPIQSPESHPYPNVIYGAEDALFAAVASGSHYAVYALKNGATEFTLIREASAQGEGLLMGAAQFDGKYFISLGGLGVFTVDSVDAPSPPTKLVTGSDNKGNFTGFIELDGFLLMVSSSGVICKLSPGDTDITEANSHSLGFSFFGALAVWRDNPKETEAPTDPSKRLLLLSRKGSNSNYSGYGYYECQIPKGFEIKSLGIIEPQFTVEKNATYKNSLGKRAINSIMQAPDGIIFASTQSYNLWGCRDGVWNYE
ncbi:MAG: hypothetical protein LBL20_04510, partial [Treponema sp.]|nr:hypothetical protein [Treponema sp.]